MTTSSPHPIPLRDLRPAFAAGLLALGLIGLTQFDLSALAPAGSLVHELLHDGRHLLGVPCH